MKSEALSPNCPSSQAPCDSRSHLSQTQTQGPPCLEGSDTQTMSSCPEAAVPAPPGRPVQRTPPVRCGKSWAAAPSPRGDSSRPLPLPPPSRAAAAAAAAAAAVRRRARPAPESPSGRGPGPGHLADASGCVRQRSSPSSGGRRRGGDARTPGPGAGPPAVTGAGGPRPPSSPLAGPRAAAAAPARSRGHSNRRRVPPPLSPL